MAEAEGYEKRLTELADGVSAEMDADVLAYSGPIEHPMDERVIDLCAARRRRENVVLVLATYGGDADAAYRIARCLQRNYKRITILLDGECKSAGTILALGSDELVLSDHAELGPLDVQLRREDDIVGRQSGLAPTQALISLAALTQDTFRQHFLSLRFGAQLPTRMSAEVAAEMAVGTFKEIYGQIDPMRLGEIDRAMKIASAYGERLVRNRGNAKEETLGTLLAGYPSHEFVIDRGEAEELFNCVRSPSDAEAALLGHLVSLARHPAGPRATIQYLGSERTMDEDAPGTGADEGREDGRQHAQDGGAPPAGTTSPDSGSDRAHEPGESRARGKGAGNGARRAAVRS